MALSNHLEILRNGTGVWNRWRREHPEVIPDLRGANLRGAVLPGIHLDDAHLEGADLEGADLKAADPFDENPLAATSRGGPPAASPLWGGPLVDQLWNVAPWDRRGAPRQRHQVWAAELWASRLVGARLRGASLRGAQLRGADLQGADLESADLEGADLRDVLLFGANLRWTHLAGADLRYARIGSTLVAGVDLSLTEGLDTVEHLAASSVGLDALEATSQGLVADASRQDEVRRFLRRAGLAEVHLAALDARAPAVPACYISYSHVDNAFARWLHKALQESGIRCWLHPHESHQDDDTLAMVDGAVRLWDKVLLCCSKAALTSWWLDAEVERAGERERRLAKLRGRKEPTLYGINLDGHLFDSKLAGDAAAVVKSRLVADFSGWEKKRARLERPLERLLEALGLPQEQAVASWKE